MFRKLLDWIVRLACAVAVIPSLAYGQNEQCMESSGVPTICLGDDISQIRGIPWLPFKSLFQDRKHRWGKYILHDDLIRLLTIKTPTQGIYDVDIAYDINKLNDQLSNNIINLKEQNILEIYQGGKSFNIISGGEFIEELLRNSNLIFCRDFYFVGYFRTETGHGTTIGFRPIAFEDGTHKLIVHYSGRRIRIDPAESSAFETNLRIKYPSLIKKADMKTKCGPLSCDGFWFRSKSPDKYTASLNALMRGKDYVVYYRPPDEYSEGQSRKGIMEYADLELELFPAFSDWYDRIKQRNSLSVPRRFNKLNLRDHPDCNPPLPEPIVPSLK